MQEDREQLLTAIEQSAEAIITKDIDGIIKYYLPVRETN